MPEPRFRSAPEPPCRLNQSFPDESHSEIHRLLWSLRTTNLSGLNAFEGSQFVSVVVSGPLLGCLTLILLRKWNESERLRAVVVRTATWWARTALCRPANDRHA